MPGTGTASDILYGEVGTRTSRGGKANGCLPLPSDLDPELLDATTRFEIEVDQVRWAGSGNQWLAQGRIPIEWEQLDWHYKSAVTGQETAEDFLRELRSFADSERKSFYEISRPIDFDAEAYGNEVSFEAIGSAEGQYKVSRQRLAAVEHVAGSGGEWRLIRFYTEAIGDEYIEIAYFIDARLCGSVTIDQYVDA